MDNTVGSTLCLSWMVSWDIIKSRSLLGKWPKLPSPQNEKFTFRSWCHLGSRMQVQLIKEWPQPCYMIWWTMRYKCMLMTWSWNPMRENDTLLTRRSSSKGSRSTDWDWTLQKCTFGVTTGKLLGFLVSDRRIEVDPSKIKAILEMPPPKSEKEIRGFLGQLKYIS